MSSDSPEAPFFAFPARVLPRGGDLFGAPEWRLDGENRWSEKFVCMRENGKKFGGGEAGGRNAEAGSDFCEGDEDEGALSEPRVRDFEARLGEHETAVEENVEIEGPGAVGDRARSIAAEEALDGEKSVEKWARREIGFNSDDGVEEARLIGEADGFGGIERGARGDAAERPNVLKGGGEGGIGRACGAG